MKRVENECVCCPPELGCLGSSCPNRNVIRFYCDKCGEEEKLYYHNGKELCEYCLLEECEVVEGSENL